MHFMLCFPHLSNFSIDRQPSSIDHWTVDIPSPTPTCNQHFQASRQETFATSSIIASTKTATLLSHTMVGHVPHATKTITARMDDVLPVFTPAPNCLDDLYLFSQECATATRQTCTYFNVGPASSDPSCVPDPKRHIATACPIFYTPVADTTHTFLPLTTGVRYKILTCCPT